MTAINIYARALQSTTALAVMHDLISTCDGYRRRSRAIGGYVEGELVLSEENVGAGVLNELYNILIGCRLTEHAYGIMAWEGVVADMRLYNSGTEAMQTMDQRTFHNKVKVQYQSDIGETAETAADENTDSSDIFGESNLIVRLSGATSSGATARRDMEIAQYAWPRSFVIAGDSYSRPPAPAQASLRIILAGYWDTLNWRYREMTLGAGNASDHVSTIAGLSEFITAGRIDTNTLSVRVDCFPVAKRLGEILAEIAKQGDASGNLWKCGVYADRKLYYEAAPTDWTYQLKDSVLCNRAGNPVPLALVEPGFLLYAPDAPLGWTKPGAANVWDDPKVRYVDEIEYVWGQDVQELRMHYADASAGMEVLSARLQKGNI
ncbi:MAG: hypothetical protein JXA14_26125 [Anaerolineae bacterium]|nr:hypothetical protein [Anaerolineae bacterium]